jgi:hypothetical protein
MCIAQSKRKNAQYHFAHLALQNNVELPPLLPLSLSSPSSSLSPQPPSEMTETVSTPSIESNKWLGLPDETWLAVLNECSYFDLHRVEGVCKKLQGLVKVRI